MIYSRVQMFYLLFIVMMTSIIDDCLREKEICKMFFDKTKFAKNLAKELLGILRSKGKISEDATEEDAFASKSLSKALLAWLRAALSTDVSDNFTDQKWIPDQVLLGEMSANSIKMFCLREFGADIADERAEFIISERGNLQSHLYSVKHLIITNFHLPHRALPPPPDYEKEAQAAIDAIVPITPVKGIK